MEFIDLKTQHARIKAQVDARIAKVLDHGQYIMGPEVREIEEKLCTFSGARHCITCASGTDALLMPLMAWGIGKGDAVFVPPFTFFATAEEPALLGATPVFVDIDPLSFTMKPDLLEKAIEAVLAQDASISPLPRAALESQLKPKAIIPVDLFGQAADYDAIMQIAERHGLKVIEDAAQSFGASQKGKKLCALACHAAATSFFPAKPLGCYGDGGAVFTDDDELAEILRSIRVHGKGSDKYDNVRIGLNGRIDTLQAAILLAKLDIFEEELAARSQVAAWYSEALSGIAAVRAPSLSPGNTSAWAQYSIVLPENTREKVVAHLRSQDIPTNIYYPTPLHMLGAFKDQGHAPNDFAVALETSRRILALPFHPYMDRETVEKVCRAIHEALL